MPSPADLAFLRFQATGRPEALAEVFDLTAAELLRIAAHLAPDAHAAEDLVQETFLAAIESRGAFAAGHDVGAWLLGILRHRAQRRWRAHTRSVDAHDARLGRRPRAADPAAEVEAIELTAEVDAAIQQLPETYRLALRLHLRHGLTATEIALAHDRPAGSVRTQLARGLALLRARLPRGLAIGAVVIACAPRGLAALRESVVRAAAHATLAPASVGVGTSVLALTMKKIVLSAAAAAIVILAGAWQLGAFAWPAFPPAVEGSVSLRADPTPASVPTAGDATPAPAPAREIVAAPRYTGRQHGTLLVRARWKDDGTPAACVTVVLLDETRPNAFLTSRAGVTGADGTVRIEQVPAGEITAVTNDEARPRVTVPVGSEASVEVLEPRWGRVRGIVVDDAGAPVAAATVIRSDRLHSRGHEIATTAADGRFAVPVGWNQHVGARKAGWVDSYASVRPTKGETVEVVLRLRGRSGAVAGVVRDARGTPVQRALVTAGWGAGATVLPDGTDAVFVPPHVALTGPDGTFRLETVPAGETYLVARAPDFADVYQQVHVATGQTTQVAITLPDGAVVAGHVLDPQGGAVAGARVTTDWNGHHYFQTNDATTAADGSFRLDSLPARRVEVLATKEHVGRASTKLVLVAGATTAWQASLVGSPVLPGRVVDETGAAMESALVQVASLDAAQRRTAKATTAADGSFAIECERAEPMSLRVSVRRGTLPSVELDEVAPGGAPITVTVPAATLPSARIRGVLVAPDGAPATGAFVVLGRRGADDYGHGVPDPATGAFTMGPFPPGEYFAFVQAREGPNVGLGTICLEAGATHDAGRIVVGEAGSLTARVTSADGQPLPSGRLEVLTLTGMHTADVPVQDGAAHLARVAPGDYLVRVQGNRSQDRALRRATIRKDQETGLDLRLFVEPTHTVTVREIPHPHRDPIREVKVDVLDAAGVLVDRAANGRKDGDAWIVRIVAPPSSGTLVVKGDNVERTRLPLPADGAIEVTLR